MSKPSQAPDGAPIPTTANTPSTPASYSTPPLDPQADPTFYTWSNTFTILLARMTGTRNVPLETSYFAAQDSIKGTCTCPNCM